MGHDMDGRLGVLFLNRSSRIDSSGRWYYQGKTVCRRAERYRLTILLCGGNIFFMIKSFKCRETEMIFSREFSKKLPADIQRSALKKLWMLNRSESMDDLRIPPHNRLEKLSGDRAGQWSIRINQQWRICFEWRAGDAYQVEIVDYH